jgi:hypothetical protein
LNFGDMLEGKTFDIYNYTSGDLVINSIEDEGFGWFHWYIDPFTLSFPYTMSMNEALPLTVKIDIPVDRPAGFMVTDTLDIQAVDGHYKVIIRVDSDLLSGLTSQVARSSSCIIETVSPNPFSDNTRISIKLDKETNVSLAVYNMQGQAVRTLAAESFSAGTHDINWDGKDNSGSRVSPGIYLLKMETVSGVDFRKIILSK